MCQTRSRKSEAAIHALHQIFNNSNAEGVLLVDASNAFSQLNCEVAPRNVQVLCPPIATVLINTYRGNAQLFVDGETLFSREGTTNGDPLAMPFYALTTIPLNKTCKIEELPGEVWFADDSTGCWSLQALCRW